MRKLRIFRAGELPTRMKVVLIVKSYENNFSKNLAFVVWSIERVD